MNLGLFFHALVVGYVVAAPVGPVNLVCIHRTLHNGRFNGFIAGLGGAVGDGLFAIVAAFGLTAISDFLLSHDGWLRLIGGVFLLVLGIRTYLAKPRDRHLKADEGDLPHAVAGTFFLTITNPVTILGFAAVFASTGLSSDATNYADASIIVAGVFSGSVAWWLSIAMLVGMFRGRIEERGLVAINRVSGVAIGLFGIAALLTLIDHPLTAL